MLGAKGPDEFDRFVTSMARTMFVLGVCVGAALAALVCMIASKGCP